MLGGGALAGLGILGAAHATLEYTDSNAFCRSCHVMDATVFAEWEETVHYRNATGMRVDCADCHIPEAFVPHMARKLGALRFLVSWADGSMDEPEELRDRRLELAQVVWDRMRERDSQTCRGCHALAAMDLEAQPARARTQHLDAERSGETCIDCHDDGIAHAPVKQPTEEPEGGFRLE